MSAAKKQRLDVFVLEKGLVPSRQRAKAMIMAGKIMVNNRPITKAGHLVGSDEQIEIRGFDMPYVSRGGLKLEGALRRFDLKLQNKVCLDVGASTGGFTDCLLQNGAARVYAVDVGYGQLAWKLRQDPRVVVIERTNIRHIRKETISEPIDLATIDVSFISLKIVIPVVKTFLKDKAIILALIKPQFEVGRDQVGKGGVVKDPALHKAVIHRLAAHFEALGLTCETVIPSAIRGPKGNREFFSLLRCQPGINAGF